VNAWRRAIRAGMATSTCGIAAPRTLALVAGLFEARERDFYSDEEWRR
jgi:hypothetical protein